MMDEDDGRDVNPQDADQERRLRREIANSNERRRMQSINAGFQSLRTLLPHHEGEKLSKAAILQQTAEYIYQLEQEKTQLLSQNSQLKRLYSLSQQGLSSPSSNAAVSATVVSDDSTTSPRLKKKRMAPSSNSTAAIENTSDLIKDDSDAGGYPGSSSSVAELSLQLLKEQRLRLRLEERLKALEQTQAASVAAAQTAQSASTVVSNPVLPTQPLKMEVVKSSSSVTAVKNSSEVSVQPRIVAATAPQTAILLTDKNGIKVEVETVTGLPQTPVNLKLPTKPTPVQVAETQVVSASTVVGKVPAKTQIVSANPAAVEELKTKAGPSVIVTQPPTSILTAVASAQPPLAATPARSYIVTTSSNPTNAARHNLDSIVEAIRHLEGDHCFSEDSHKVVNEEVVEYNVAPPKIQANLTHNVTVAKNLVPSKIQLGLKPVQVAPTSTIVTTTNPIPATLLPKQPHPPSAVLHTTTHSSKENSIIIVKQCQT